MICTECRQTASREYIQNKFIFIIYMLLGAWQVHIHMQVNMHQKWFVGKFIFPDWGILCFARYIGTGNGFCSKE